MNEDGAIAVEILTEALPGFRALIAADSSTIQLRGALKIGAVATMEGLVYPLMHGGLFQSDDMIFDALEPDAQKRARRARQIGRTRDELRPHIAEAIVRPIRENAIAADGLEDEIAERVRRARELGETEGYARGLAAGYSDGRRDMLAEILSAGEEGDEQ